MKFYFQLDKEEIKKIHATMEITMTIQDWLDLKSNVSSAYPGYQLRNEIDKMIDQATQAFFMESKK